MTGVSTHPSFPMLRTAGPLSPPPDYALFRSQARFVPVTMWSGARAWVATRWEDVRAVLASNSFSVDPNKPGYAGVSAAREAQVKARKAFINMDDPDHMRFRRMLTREFVVKRLEELRPTVEKIVAEHVEALLDGPTPADLVGRFAMPIPSTVISHMLGVPYGDHEKLTEWSTTRNDHTVSPEEINEAAAKLDDYFERLFAEKERSADAGADIISRLARDQIATGNMTRDEAVQIAVLLYSGGHGTTASQIGLGTLSLLQHPDQAQYLREDLTRIPAAIEEMLRFHTVTHVNSARVAIEDTEIAGHKISAGETVYALLSAANRDPEVFAKPDKFDVTRDASNHMAFAFGVHQCLGQPLARLELGIVFATILTRLPHLKLAVPFEELRFRLRSQVYGPETLPVTW